MNIIKWTGEWFGLREYAPALAGAPKPPPANTDPKLPAANTEPKVYNLKNSRALKVALIIAALVIGALIIVGVGALIMASGGWAALPVVTVGGTALAMKLA